MLEALAARLRPLQGQPWPLQLPRPPYPLAATITGCGCERRTTPDYDWVGLKRGETDWALFQYTLSGAGRVQVHGQESIVPPGSAMLLVFPDDNRYWLPPGGMWEHFYLCLGGREAIAAVKHVTARRGWVIPLPADGAVVLQAAAACIQFRRGKFASTCEVSAATYQLLMTLIQDTAVPAAATPGRAPQLARAVALAQERYAEDLSVDDLARAAGYSRYHFTRLFTQAYHCSPMDYLCDLRLGHAARLLRESDAAVKDIARACGFADAGYFCKVFRRAQGTTPGQFRASGIIPGGAQLVS